MGNDFGFYPHYSINSLGESDNADNALSWVKLSDLYQNRAQIEDAHLLITMCRLIHKTTNALNFSRKTKKG